jgi:hypothetical protein
LSDKHGKTSPFHTPKVLKFQFSAQGLNQKKEALSEEPPFLTIVQACSEDKDIHALQYRSLFMVETRSRK